MYCQKCGNKIDEDAKVCAQCGAPVAKTMSFLMDKKISPQHIKIIIIAVSIIAVLGLVKLMVKSPEENLVGTWVCTEDDDWFLTFGEDGKFCDSEINFLSYTTVGAWKVLSDNGVLYLDSLDDDPVDTYNFELKGNKLIIYTGYSDNSYYSFRKVE